MKENFWAKNFRKKFLSRNKYRLYNDYKQSEMKIFGKKFWARTNAPYITYIGGVGVFRRGLHPPLQPYFIGIKSSENALFRHVFAFLILSRFNVGFHQCTGSAMAYPWEEITPFFLLFLLIRLIEALKFCQRLQCWNGILAVYKCTLCNNFFN